MRGETHEDEGDFYQDTSVMSTNIEKMNVEKTGTEAVTRFEEGRTCIIRNLYGRGESLFLGSQTAGSGDDRGVEPIGEKEEVSSLSDITVDGTTVLHEMCELFLTYQIACAVDAHAIDPILRTTCHPEEGV